MRDGDKFSLGVTRRTFVAGLGGVAALSVIGTSARAATGKEAPELAALVCSTRATTSSMRPTAPSARR